MTFFNKAGSVLRQNLCNKHVSIEGYASNLSIFQLIRHASNRPSLQPSRKILRGDVIDAGGIAESCFKAFAAKVAKVVMQREGNSKRSGVVAYKTAEDANSAAIEDSDAADPETKKVCIGSSFAEHNRMKRNLYQFKSLFLSKKRNENRNIPTRTRSPMIYNSSLYSNSIYCSAPPNHMKRKRQRKRIELPTHYLEVNYRTLKAVMFYGPNIGHIPHNIKSKDMDMLTNERLRNTGYGGYGYAGKRAG